MIASWASYYLTISGYALRTFGRRLWVAWCNVWAVAFMVLPFALGLTASLLLRLFQFMVAAAEEGYERGRKP